MRVELRGGEKIQSRFVTPLARIFGAAIVNEPKRRGFEAAPGRGGAWHLSGQMLVDCIAYIDATSECWPR